MMQATFGRPATAIVTLLLLSVTARMLGAIAAARHVVIIGLDGTSPDGIQNAKTPNIDHLRQNGAWTFHARAVMPTSSSPNWASMIMGAGPEQHGVTSNDWQPHKFEIKPTVVGTGGIFPTIFGVLREQRPSAITGIFHDWDGFARLVEPGAPNVVENGDGPVDTVKRAIAFLQEKKPDFTFIHLDHVDHAGHEIGHGTAEYYAAVAEADRLVGEVIKALKQAGMWDHSILLITSDHGGVGKRHGNATMAEIEIPWILSGPGVARGREIRSPVNTFDTAATVAYILGLKAPSAWIGRPVLEAFSK